jgi:hypothetical protein
MAARLFGELMLSRESATKQPRHLARRAIAIATFFAEAVEEIDISKSGAELLAEIE